jgi:hypothetical protein
MLCFSAFMVVLSGYQVAAVISIMFLGPGLIFTAGPWAFFRLVDLILGGPQRRKGWIKVQAIDR